MSQSNTTQEATTQRGMSAPVDVLAVQYLKELAGTYAHLPETQAEILAQANAIDELIGVADEAYAELLADSHRDGPRCSLLTRLEAALRAVGGAK